MFGRKAKRIKRMKENLREINRQKLEYRTQNLMLQKCLDDYTRTCDTFMSTIKELMSKLEETTKSEPTSKKKTTKKVVKDNAK